MNIAFDTDGVLVDTERFMFEQGLRYFKKKAAEQRKIKHNVIKDEEIIKDKHVYGIKEIFDC
jgi:FMN phosphatase YigB (HAD superfamily)